MKYGTVAAVLAVMWVTTAAPWTQAETPAVDPQATVEITYRTIGQAALPPAWDVLLQAAAAGEESIARHPVTTGKPLMLHLPAGSSWEVSAELPGFWVRRKPLTVGRGGETTRLELDLWPLGRIAGRIKLQQKDIAPPREVLVNTVAAPALLNRPPMPPGALNCPVDEKGNWSCSLPAATFDLVITAEGFTPQYRWGVEVPAAKTVALGTFQLERGASVAAWVAVEAGKIDPKLAVARLSFVSACDADAKAALELNRMAVEKPVSKDGFLQITGVAPGIYTLEVRHAGFAPAVVTDVRVAPQTETFLPEPLLLARPIVLDFEVTPARDERGEPWRALVSRRAETSRSAALVYDGPVDSEGRFTVPEQSPGWFEVKILDAQGNRVHSEPERHFDASTRHSIELHRITVEGRLRLGSAYPAATLWFGGEHGARRVKMESDEEGRFSGVLSSEGSWVVEIEGTEPRFRARTRTEIQADRSGRATVSIELPDTRVFGRIVGENGQPPPQSYLVITTQDLDQTVQAEAAGTFDVRGLPDGLLSLIATDSGAAQSERALVNAISGSSVGPIELRLRPIRRLSGTVLSPLGPVVGARVVALANSPSVGSGQAMSGPEGVFSMEIPANITSATAIVKAPGFGTQAFPVKPEGEPISLTLAEAAGEISIALPRTGGELQQENLVVSLFQNGLEIPISVLREDAVAATAAGPDGRSVMRLAHLAPGQYSACITKKPVESKGSLTHKPEAAVICDSGQLAAGTLLTLALDAAPSESQGAQRD